MRANGQITDRCRTQHSCESVDRDAATRSVHQIRGNDTCNAFQRKSKASSDDMVIGCVGRFSDDNSNDQVFVVANKYPLHRLAILGCRSFFVHRKDQLFTKLLSAWRVVAFSCECSRNAPESQVVAFAHVNDTPQQIKLRGTVATRTQFPCLKHKTHTQVLRMRESRCWAVLVRFGTYS